MDMKEFVRVIQIPTANGQRLQEYGLFHCIFFALTIAAMVFAVIYTLKKGEKNLYFLYVLSSVLMWVGELYKQFCYSFKTGTFHYEWYFFPWQFCSTPLYTFLFCAIAKKGKLYDAVSAYNATYALFAGTCVMLYPSTLVNNYGISFQSLLHHALMMITGVSALVLYAKKFSFQRLSPAKTILSEYSKKPTRTRFSLSYIRFYLRSLPRLSRTSRTSSQKRRRQNDLPRVAINSAYSPLPEKFRLLSTRHL